MAADSSSDRLLIFPVIQGVASDPRPPFSPHLEKFPIGSSQQWRFSGKTPYCFNGDAQWKAQFSEFPIYIYMIIYTYIYIASSHNWSQCQQPPMKWPHFWIINLSPLWNPRTWGNTTWKPMPRSQIRRLLAVMANHAVGGAPVSYIAFSWCQ